ncbi:MAG: hypothetical protein H0Z19_05280 [Archaeoglobus sp.]|uniref:hypothetical protein n=1 Tax=Archaeoglobus sp. TaxID=1872626 RepID=UPI001E091C8A|nr:hypothetical protein [Archaeoglobus sp.]MBO8179880.1 hypothetical protein [Archaeoglobus sp.]
MNVQELINLFQISMMLNVFLVFFMLFILAMAKPVLPYVKGKITRRPVVAVWHKDDEVRFEVAREEDETYNTKRYSWLVQPGSVGKLGGVRFAIGLPEVAYLIPPRLSKTASLLSKLGIRKVVEVDEAERSLRVLNADAGELVKMAEDDESIIQTLRSFVNPRALVEYVVQGISAREFRVRIESAKLDVKMEKLRQMDVLKAAVAIAMILAVLFTGYLLISHGTVNNAVQAVQNVGKAVDTVTNPPIGMK